MNNEMIKIEKQTIGNEEVNAVDARELWVFLESKRDFSNWVETKVVTSIFFEENIDWEVYNKFVVNSGSVGGRPKIDYALTVDTAKKVAMSEQTQKGNEIRKYFINCEKALKEILSKSLQIELQKKDKTIFKLEDQVLHLEQIIARSESIQICEFAKNISKTFGKAIGGNTLFQILRNKKYLMEGRGKPEHNQPYQKYIHNGYFELKASKSGFIGNTTYITMFGRQQIAPVLIRELELFGKEEPKPTQISFLDYLPEKVKSVTLNLK